MGLISKSLASLQDLTNVFWQYADTTTSPGHVLLNPDTKAPWTPGLVTDVAKRWADDFGGTALDASKWEVETSVGGMTYSVSASALSVTMGTATNAELRLLSKETFTIPFDLSVIALMSQRIANNSVYFEAIEIDAEGLPVAATNLAGDWRNRVSILLDGTTATTGKLETVGEDSTVALTQSGAITSTATAVELTAEARAKDIQMISATPDTAAPRNSSVLLNSSEVPDPNKTYKIRLRFKNGASAPASSTVVTIRRLYIQDATEITAEIVSGRGDSNTQRGIAVNVANSFALGTGTNLIGDVGFQTRSTATGSFSKLLVAASLATTNATALKASAGRLYQVRGFNASSATKYLKLYNKASAPTVGTDTPVETHALPVGSFTIDYGPIGDAFATGIAFALTGAAANADTTAIAAGDITALNFYFA